jgi:preprotein translocase subunit SecY
MPGNITAAPSVSTGIGRRAVVTAGAVALLVVGEHVPLPFIEWNEIRFLARYGPAFKLLSPLALGVMPFFTAFLLVECVAEVVPRLRRLRHGSATERASLTRAASIFAVALAAMQGWGIATYLQTVRDTHGYPLLEYGLGNVLGVTGALVLGTVAAGCAAVLVSRHGLGNGFAVLFAAGALQTVLELGKSILLQPTGSWSDVTLVMGLALVVAVPLVAAHQRRHGGAGPHRNDW